MSENTSEKAIFHDWIFSIELPEKILENLCELFPGADLYTFKRDYENLPPNIANRHVFDSELSGNYPEIWKHIEKFEKEGSKLPLNEYKVIITNSVGPMRWVKEAGTEFPKHLAYIPSPYPFIHEKFENIKKIKYLGTLFSRFSENTFLALYVLDFLDFSVYSVGRCLVMSLVFSSGFENKSK